MAFDTADRRGVGELVGHCLRAGKLRAGKLRARKPDPAEPGPQPPLPIVLLWGPRSSGKSELLNHLQERFSSRRPHARWDGRMLSELRPHEVALRLASHLNNRVEGLGRLQFPRLSIGVAAIRGAVGIDGSGAARTEMIKRTAPKLGRLRTWAAATVTVLLSTAGVDPETGHDLGLELGNGVGAVFEKLRVRRGRN